MARPRPSFQCTECGAVAPKWLGRCPACSAWNSLEARAALDAPEVLVQPSVAAVPIGEVPLDGTEPFPTGVAELDRVLGGGLVPGSVTLLGGEPGIGKSTLTLQAASGLATAARPVLVVTAEESVQQVRRRAERLGALRPRLLIASETRLAEVLAHLDANRPGVLVLDSIQTVAAADLPGAAGSVSQVSGCAARLAVEARQRGVAVVLVGHVTKDGTLAGPRVLEHLVDTVLTFEGDRHHSLRLLRAVKHRFGSTDELGVFTMTADGLSALDDPSQLFLADRSPGAAGSAVVAALDGRRPLLVEVQALTGPAPAPRRTVRGLDPQRVTMVLAVLGRHAPLRTAEAEVFAAAVGGARVVEPAADLGVALAVASSLTRRPVPPDVVAVGEVGLGGEIRQVPGVERRLAEAKRLGFTRAVVPYLTPDVPGITLVRERRIHQVLAALDLQYPAKAPPAR